MFVPGPTRNTGWEKEYLHFRGLSINIDTVIIGGKVRKFRGNLIGINMEKFRQLADESRNYLFAKAGYKLDIFSS